MKSADTTKGLEGDVTLSGNALGLGDFKIIVTRGPETNKYPEQEHLFSLQKPLDRTLYRGFDVPGGHVWRTKGKNATRSLQYGVKLSTNCRYSV